MRKRKLSPRQIVTLVCVSVVVLGILLWALFAATFRCTLFTKELGRCLSISLVGKWELQDVDKAVITYQGKTVATTDTEFIRQLTEETQTATHGGTHGKTATIDLYRGDELVRSMDWADCCDIVTVYEADATHWVFSWWIADPYEYGCVTLSDDLANQLHALVN